MSVVTVIQDPEQSGALLAWSRRIAAAYELELIVLCLLGERDGDPVVRINPSDPVRDPLLAKVCGQAEGARVYALRSAATDDLVLAQLSERKPSWTVVGIADESLVRRLFADTSLPVMLLRGSEPVADDPSIAVAALGGLHARHAMRLASRLAGSRGRVIVLDPGDRPEGRSDAQRLASLGEAAQVEVRPAAGADPEQVIDGAGEHDLLLAGTDDAAAACRLVSRGSRGAEPQGTVAAVRGPPATPQRTRDAFVAMLRRVVPRLEREHRKKLDETVAVRSKLELDFLVLIVVSTAIASFGLVKNSGAVVIGAMLVAPLMTPMIGSGLALVQGNTVLALRSATAITIGFLVSFLVSALVGITLQPPETWEMAQRSGGADLLDFAIALLSGFAAAWASARPGLVGAIAGVAIAAALVPPIATVGLSAATGRWGEGLNAAGLFAVNVVAIIFASAVALLILGMRPVDRQNRVPDWQAWGFAFIVMLAAIVLIVVL